MVGLIHYGNSQMYKVREIHPSGNEMKQHLHAPLNIPEDGLHQQSLAIISFQSALFIVQPCGRWSHFDRTL